MLQNPTAHQQYIYAVNLLHELMRDEVCYSDNNMRSLLSLIQRCICFDGQIRPEAEDILRHIDRYF